MPEFPRDLSPLRITSKVLAEESDPCKCLGKAVNSSVSTVSLGSAGARSFFPQEELLQLPSSQYLPSPPCQGLLHVGSCQCPQELSALVGDPVCHFQRCLLVQVDAN